ncbi:hypothetical protein BGW42_005888 [Actinomortierella wolfii]|nr:hypothetical protein BGW42_005888 [Actinomortierella wolfii]
MIHRLLASSRTAALTRSVGKIALRDSEHRASALAQGTMALSTVRHTRCLASFRSSQKHLANSPMTTPSPTSSFFSLRAKSTSADTRRQQKQQQQQQQQQRRANPFQGGAPDNSVVAYVGPYMRSLQSGKSVAFVFGACGCMAVPATLYLGNTEQLLAVVAGLVSLSPSIILHSLTRHDVSKISVEGTASKTTPSAVRVNSESDSIQMSIEQLNWRGKPNTVSVASKDLIVDEAKSKGNKVVWKLPGSIGRREEKFRIDKVMLMNNPSFAFVLDQIEEQSKRKKAEAAADNQN